VPAIQSFLVEPAHCCKSFGRDLFKFADKRGREWQFDKIDCTHLKLNYTYLLCQNCNKPYEVFVHWLACVIKQHFDNHAFCKKGAKKVGWCKYKDNNDMIAKSKEEHCYYDKLQELELYAVMWKYRNAWQWMKC